MTSDFTSRTDIGTTTHIVLSGRCSTTPKIMAGVLDSYHRNHSNEFINPLLDVSVDTVGDSAETNYILLAHLHGENNTGPVRKEPNAGPFGSVSVTPLSANSSEIILDCSWPTLDWALEYFERLAVHLQVMYPELKTNKKGDAGVETEAGKQANTESHGLDLELPKDETRYREAWKHWTEMNEEYKLEVKDGMSKKAQPTMEDFRVRVIDRMGWKVSTRTLSTVKKLGKAGLLTK